MDYDSVMLKSRAFEQAGDALIVIDRDGIICGWNAMAVELFGFAEEDAVGRNIAIIIPERLREAHERGFRAALQAGHILSDGQPRRTKALRCDGQPIYVVMTFAIITDDADDAIGSVAVARPSVEG